MSITRHDRLQEYYRRLRSLPPARSHDEAFKRMSDVLNEVENQLSGIAYDPSTRGTDGRLYPPQPDSERRSQDPNVRVYRTKNHRVQIGSDGSIEILKRLDDGTFWSEFRVDGAS